MKKVKFKTSVFGLLNEGTIIKLDLLGKDDDTGVALLWAKPDRDGCGCLILAKLDENNIYIDYDNRSYINYFRDGFDPDFRKFLKNQSEIITKRKQNVKKNRSIRTRTLSRKDVRR